MANEVKVKKTMVLLGSPRKKGNSAILANQIISGAEAVGSEVETIYIHGENIACCDGCDACQRPNAKGCHIDDDMQAIYPKLIEADAWVFAYPVYWFSVSAQIKLLLDRCYALHCYGDNPYAGKRIAIAMSYGGEDPFDSGGINALRMFQDIFNYVGSDIVGMVYGSGLAVGDIKANTALLKKAEDLGKKLVVG